jgi:hypothetical protein
MQKSETTASDPNAAPVGWIDPKQFNLVWRRMMAYRRQLIANGIKPDLENYSFEESNTYAE